VLDNTVNPAAAGRSRIISGSLENPPGSGLSDLISGSIEQKKVRRRKFCEQNHKNARILKKLQKYSRKTEY